MVGFVQEPKISITAFWQFAPLSLQCSVRLCVPWGAAGSGWPGGKLPGGPRCHEPVGPAGQLLPIHTADPPVPHQHPQRSSLALQQQFGKYFHFYTNEASIEFEAIFFKKGYKLKGVSWIRKTTGLGRKSTNCKAVWCSKSPKGIFWYLRCCNSKCCYITTLMQPTEASL